MFFIKYILLITLFIFLAKTPILTNKQKNKLFWQVFLGVIVGVEVRTKGFNTYE